MPVDPRVGGGAVEQHDRARRRLGAQRRTFAFAFLHRIGAAVFDRDGDLPFGELSSVVIFADEDDFVAFAFAGCFLFEFLVPTTARQTAPAGHHAKVSFAQRDDLGAAPIVFVFSLIDVILPAFGRVEEGFGFRFVLGGEKVCRERE